MNKKFNRQNETIERFSDNFTHSKQYTTDPQVQYSKGNNNDKNKLKFTKSNETIFTDVCLISKDMPHSEFDIPSHEILPEPMKQDATLPAHETPEDTAPCPMTANAVYHIVAHKLARNTAANSTEDLISNDEPSQAEPLCLLSMFAKAEHPGSFSLPTNFNAKTMAWYWRKYELEISSPHKLTKNDNNRMFVHTHLLELYYLYRI